MAEEYAKRLAAKLLENDQEHPSLMVEFESEEFASKVAHHLRSMGCDVETSRHGLRLTIHRPK